MAGPVSGLEWCPTIGTLEGEGVTTVPVADEEAGHRKMVELLESGAADAAVTMAFPFPHRRVHCGPGGDARPW